MLGGCAVAEGGEQGRRRGGEPREARQAGERLASRVAASAQRSGTALAQERADHRQGEPRRDVHLVQAPDERARDGYHGRKGEAHESDGRRTGREPHRGGQRDVHAQPGGAFGRKRDDRVQARPENHVAARGGQAGPAPAPAGSNGADIVFPGAGGGEGGVKSAEGGADEIAREGEMTTKTLARFFRIIDTPNAFGARSF
mmetsp:Transcript_3332/g.13992  ORF Transcript_3332/g.13992 Transcript_3332/m.13992 type:complete len:200 (-) Transcript_3332:1629-2228(-)